MWRGEKRLGSNSGEDELSDVLQQNEQHLEHLGCAWNEIRGAGALKVAKALSSNMGLQNTDLHFNAFGDAAATVYCARGGVTSYRNAVRPDRPRPGLGGNRLACFSEQEAIVQTSLY
jgi:hypothetical protein